MINNNKLNIDFQSLKTPVYVVDKRLIDANLKILDYVQRQADCEILLALKGFAMHAFFPRIGKILHGIAASGLFEARLGFEKMGKQVHVFSPAFIEDEFDDIMRYCDHIIFNSFAQYEKYKPCIELNKDKKIECGIRINPEYSEVKTPVYDPCYTNSRLGVTLANFQSDKLCGIDGMHFHTMCEQNSDTLERTIKVIEEKFGKYLYDMKWVNFGGGHHITRDDYDIEKLIDIIKYIKDKYDVKVYLEPGEAIALNTGFLVASVLDIVHNLMDIAILDTSASCHMPDVIEMPYRPEIIGAKGPSEYDYTYKLGGMTCLAGDVIGDYSFKKPLEIGDKLVFCDMAHYTMVKNNTFNGMNLPSIAVSDENGIKVIRKFSYKDYENRLS